MSWRKIKTHREETKAVKAALDRIGLKAKVGHGTGTAWAWLEIWPVGKWTKAQNSMAMRLIKTITGRTGDYDGEILIH